MANGLVHRLATSRLRECRRREGRSRSRRKRAMKSRDERLFALLECNWLTKSRTTVTTNQKKNLLTTHCSIALHAPGVHYMYLPVYFLIGSLHCLHLLFLDTGLHWNCSQTGPMFQEVTTLLSKRRQRQTLKAFLAQYRKDSQISRTFFP